MRNLEQSTPLQQFPTEIVEDILLRLPADALCQFRCVSKSAWGFVTDPRFIKMHLHQSMKNNPKIILASGGKLFTADFEARVVMSAIEIHLPHSDGRIRLIGCCNGLICFNHENTIYVSNPVTREHMKFTTDSNYPARLSSHLDFGYSPFTGEYKVLCFLKKEFGGRIIGVAVRTLGDNSWRSVEHLPYNFGIFTRGALLNGILYWVACSEPPDRTTFIACFDLRDEQFREMLLPDFGDLKTTLRIAVVEGILCIFCWFQYKPCFEIWVMKDYGDEKSWTKQFSENPTKLTTKSGYLKVFGFQKNGEILVQNDYSRIVLYDPVNSSISDLHIHGIPSAFEACNHMESLVSPMAGNILQGN